jgi:transposase InsO family protein
LTSVLYIPKLVVNLFSVWCLVLENYSVNFKKNSFEINKDIKLIMTGCYIGNLPSLEFENVKHSTHLSNSEFLHKSLGHVRYHRLRKKLGIPLKIVHDCESCAVGKVTRASFSSVHQTASRPFEEIHLDLIGPIWPASKEGHRYILTIVDSSTRFCATVPIKLKSDVAATISFLVDVEAKQFGYYPTTIHSDRGSEFLNSTLKAFCASHLIKQRISDPYTPQQNGLAERFNRTILESLRTILEDSGIDKRFWNKIAKVSSLTLNQIPTHRSKKSPFELFMSRVEHFLWITFAQ